MVCRVLTLCQDEIQWADWVDPLCRRYGVRMIVVDRPGIGATPVVPLNKRIEVACRTSCFHSMKINCTRWGYKLTYSTCSLGAGTSKCQTSTSPSSLSRDLVSPSPSFRLNRADEKLRFTSSHTSFRYLSWWFRSPAKRLFGFAVVTAPST
jgi:hypothetical protein